MDRMNGILSWWEGMAWMQGMNGILDLAGRMDSGLGRNDGEHDHTP